MEPTQLSEAPQLPIAQSTPVEDTIQLVADGQKRVIYAILVYFAATVLIQAAAPIAGLLALVSFVLGWSGIMRLGKGLGMGLGSRVMLGLLMLVPIVSLMALLVLNSRATTRLRAAGYHVGFFGASK
jgi:hypothetical protein